MKLTKRPVSLTWCRRDAGGRCIICSGVCFVCLFVFSSITYIGEKISDEFAYQGHRSRSFFQRIQEVYDFLLGITGGEIPSPMASFSN